MNDLNYGKMRLWNHTWNYKIQTCPKKLPKNCQKNLPKISIGNFKWGIGRENFIKLVLNNVLSQFRLKKSWSGLIDVQKKSGCKINSKLSLNFKPISSNLLSFNNSLVKINLQTKEFHLNFCREGNFKQNSRPLIWFNI